MKNVWTKRIVSVVLAALTLVLLAPAAKATQVQVYAAVDTETRASIESSLYNAEYYAKANEDVAVALNNDAGALYQHWLNYGKAEGRNASLVFNAKYYLEVNPEVAAEVGNDYVAAYEHFVNEGLLEGLESSPVFSVKYYLQANTDVANAFNNDYVMAAKHFNESAIAEGRSGSGYFDYTVYRECNTDVAALYGDYVQGYYIHYINHGRAEGRTGGLSAGSSGNIGGDTGSGDSGITEIDTSAPSYRIFDADYYYLRNLNALMSENLDENGLYLHWINGGISEGLSGSPVLVPWEYLELNKDVAELYGDDYAGAIWHFLNYGIYEGRTGSYIFDYTVYADCNSDVKAVFGDDIVGYYAHYVKHGASEDRTAALAGVSASTFVTSPEGVFYKMSYDDKGRVTRQEYYDQAGTRLGTNTVSYYDHYKNYHFRNEATRESASMSYYYDDESGVLMRFDYDGKRLNEPVEYVELVSRNADGSPVWKFSKLEPRTVISDKYNEDGTPAGYEKEQYDTEGNLIFDAKKIYTDSGELKSYVEHWYENGRVVCQKDYNAEEKITSAVIREYDENGTLTYSEHLSYHSNGVLWSQVKSYCENGNAVYTEGYYYNRDGELETYNECVVEYGRTLKETVYLPDGTLSKWTDYEYYENFTKKSEITYSADGEEIAKTEYDEKGKKVYEMTQYFNSAGEKSHRYEYEYENGQKIRYVIRKADGSIKESRTYEYYSDGKLKKVITYDGTGEVIGRSEYNENGELINGDDYEYAEDGTVTGWSKTEYDVDGVHKKVTYYNSYGVVDLICEYDENDIIIRERGYIYTVAGDYTGRNIWLYENGLRIQEIQYDADDNITLQNEWSYHENGKVKQEIKYYKGTGQIRQLRRFYENGKEQYYRDYRYNSEDVCISSSDDEYAPDGKHTKSGRYYGDGTIEYYYCYEYNANDMLSKESKYVTGDVLEYYICYEYDAAGNKIKECRYSSDGSLETHAEWEYYENGKCKKLSRYYGEGTEKPEHILEYNEAGRIIFEARYFYRENDEGYQRCEITKWNENGEKIYKEECEYNLLKSKKPSYRCISEYENGKEIKTTRYMEYGAWWDSMEYEYHENGKLKLDKYYNGGALNSATEYDESGAQKYFYDYHYNAAGELEWYLKVTYNDDGSIASNQKYDAEGNELN